MDLLLVLPTTCAFCKLETTTLTLLDQLQITCNRSIYPKTICIADSGARSQNDRALIDCSAIHAITIVLGSRRYDGCLTKLVFIGSLHGQATYLEGVSRY